MRREELTELHFITPHLNLTSLLQYGIQSHRRAEVGRKKGLLQAASIAMHEVQYIREGIRVPGGKELHDYANLYFCARNPMMFKRKDGHAELCVLRIAPTILEIEGAIVTDRNAAASICRFWNAADGLNNINLDMIFADDWRHPNHLIAYVNHRAIKCAEVLIPNSVPPRFIVGAYVSCAETATAIEEIAPDLPIQINEKLFFREEPK